MPATFSGVDLGVYEVDPGAMTQTEKVEDIEMTGLAGIQEKSFGLRPYGAEFEVSGFYVESDHAGVEADLQALEALEKTVGTFIHGDGEVEAEQVELVLVTRGAREMCANSVLAYYKAQFRQVREP
jgi:hypothetical protein